MTQVKLRELGNQNAGITLPWNDLKRDGLLTDGNVPNDQTMHIHRIGEGIYLVRAAYNGDLPEVRETDIVQNAVARELMDRRVISSRQPRRTE